MEALALGGGGDGAVVQDGVGREAAEPQALKGRHRLPPQGSPQDAAKTGSFGFISAELCGDRCCSSCAGKRRYGSTRRERIRSGESGKGLACEISRRSLPSAEIAAAKCRGSALLPTLRVGLSVGPRAWRISRADVPRLSPSRFAPPEFSADRHNPGNVFVKNNTAPTHINPRKHHRHFASRQSMPGSQNLPS